MSEETNKTYTPKQIEEYRKTRILFLDQQHELLFREARNEDLKAKISEAKTRDVVAKLRFFELTSSPEEKESEEESKSEES